MRPNIYQTSRASPTDNSIIKGFAKVIREDCNDIDAKHCLRSQISSLKIASQRRRPATSWKNPISNLKLEIQNPLGRIDANNFLFDINLNADVMGHRNQKFTCCIPGNDQN